MRRQASSPAKKYGAAKVARIDASRLRDKAQQNQRQWLSSLSDTAKFNEIGPRIFQPKGETELEAVLAVSIIGPIGIPQEQAVYPQVATADGKQMKRSTTK